MYEYIPPEQSGNAEQDLDRIFDAFSDVCKQLNYDIPLAEKNIDDIKKRLNGTADYVVEQGTSSGWNYRKWNSGRIEAWIVETLTNVACTTAWPYPEGSLFESQVYTTPTFSLMRNVDQTQMSVLYSSAGVMVQRYGNQTCFVRPTSLTVDEIKVAYYAIGRWK